MGRRNKSKRDRWEDDDEGGIDRAEMEWFNRRTSTSAPNNDNKRQKTASDNGETSDRPKKSNTNSDGNDASKVKSKIYSGEGI